MGMTTTEPTQIPFVRIKLVGAPLPRCGHGSHTGNQCARDAVARVVPETAQWMNRFRCEVHAGEWQRA